MKDEVKVFLLSNKKEHYDLFVQKGYKDIKWLKSTPEVLSFLLDNPNYLETMDLVCVNEIFYDGKNSKKVYEKVYKEAFVQKLPYIEISNNMFSLFTNKIARTNLKKDDVFNILRRFDFNKKSKAIKPLISKDASSLKVLFVGDPLYFPFVESYFNCQNISLVKCVSDIDLHNRAVIEDICSYDIVVSGSNNYLIECADSLSLYLEDKNHLLYLVSFNFSRFNDTNLAHVTLTNTNNCDIDRKTISTFRDYNKLYQYILDVTMSEYAKLNDGFSPIGLKTFDEIQNEYIVSRNKFIEETDKIWEKIQTIDNIEHFSRIFMRKHMRRENTREFNGLRFERLEDGIRISFIHENMMLARITYYNNNINLKNPYYKEFNFEVANSKGYLMNIGLRSIYDDRRNVLHNAYPVIRDDDFIKIEGIYKKLINLLNSKEPKILKLK